MRIRRFGFFVLLIVSVFKSQELDYVVMTVRKLL